MEALGKMVLTLIAIIAVVGFFMNPDKMKSEPLQQSMDTSKYMYNVVKDMYNKGDIVNETNSNITSQALQE